MKTSSPIQWFASCPKGIESLLMAELATLGAEQTRETVAGVYFEGPLALGYRACLWSRLANRVLLPIADLEVADGDDLYRELQTICWRDWFAEHNSFAIDFSGQNDAIRNTHFGALRSKDAVVDWFREDCGKRPPVAKRNPDIRLNIRLAKGRARVSLDFSGGSLHRRGYGRQAGEAPLKENLAAAILLRADWPAMAARGGALIDPMCGAGTLLLEGAMMAADMAPGLWRQQYGFEGWPGHNQQQWQALLADAKGRAERGLARPLPEIRGYDGSAPVIRRAQENIAAMGLGAVVRVSCKELAELQKPTHRELPDGLLVCNPPYGERLGEKDSLRYLYRQLGEMMLAEFGGWQAAVFTGDLDLGRATGLRSHKRYALWNGALPCTLLLFDLSDNELRGSAATAGRSAPQTNEAQNNEAQTNEGQGGGVAASELEPVELSPGAAMFANRIRKNRKRLASWVKRERIECYRLYDADMPEYAVAVDVYGEQIHVAEYQAPKTVDQGAAEQRLAEVKQALPLALGLAPGQIVYKQRRRQRGNSQYQKQSSSGELFSVREGAAQLLVNLQDYLDTGLFLDHRPLRLRLASEAKSCDFLNLYCYTGSATIHAALAGARTTTSVDMSNTYLAWLRKNLAHNGLSEAHNASVRANCSEWLQQASHRYDLILLDPPSFSNSSAMQESFDVQRDHVALVTQAMALLRPGGQLYFSNNRRGFKLAPEITDAFECEDISASTLDPDFQRNQKIHVCWLLRHRPE